MCSWLANSWVWARSGVGGGAAGPSSRSRRPARCGRAAWSPSRSPAVRPHRHRGSGRAPGRRPGPAGPGPAGRLVSTSTQRRGSTARLVEPAPTQSGGRSSSWRALSLTTVTRSCGSRRPRPSLTPCSMRLAVLHEPGDLRRLHAERLPLDPAREQQRAASAEHAGDAEVGQQVGDDVTEPLPGRRVVPADRGDADDRRRTSSRTGTVRRRAARVPGATSNARPRPALQHAARRPAPARVPELGRVGGRTTVRSSLASATATTRRPCGPTPRRRAARAGLLAAAIGKRTPDGGLLPRFSAADSARRPSVRRRRRADWAIEIAPTATSTPRTMSTGAPATARPGTSSSSRHVLSLLRAVWRLAGAGYGASCGAQSAAVP